MKAIRELVPEDDTIDLLVLSHTDSDHNAAVPEIVNSYYIDRVLRTGARHFGKFPATLRDARAAIARAVEEDDTIDLNLNEVEFPNRVAPGDCSPGATRSFSSAFFLFFPPIPTPCA